MTDLDEAPDSDRAHARAAREALVGRTIAGRYRVRRLLGQGGMGAVYEAEHTGLGKLVAIKFVDQEFATDESVIARFAREARAMSRIESAHIVTVFDAGAEEGRPFLVMELLRGEDLGERLRRMHRVPLADSMHVTAQVLKGLARAHAAGIVHRDLKPDNVFLTRGEHDPLFAKIVDFGISKIERPRSDTSPLALTGRGTVLGTPFYMSPEQAQASADVDARADLYSVGAILFECLSGRPPHTGETYEQVILSTCMKDAPDLRAIDPKIPAPVAAFVAKALAREKSDRYTSAERMLAALHEVAPAERTRVPLEAPANETMLSAGVRTPSAPDAQVLRPGVATRLGVASLDATIVDDAPPMSDPTPAPRSLRARDSLPTPSSVPVAPTRGGKTIAAAVVATLAGIGVTVALVAWLGRGETHPAPVEVSASVSSAPSAAPSDVPSAQPVSSGSAEAPETVLSAPPVTASASPPPPPPHRTSGKPVASSSSLKPLPPPSRTTKPPSLDIQRDLP